MKPVPKRRRQVHPGLLLPPTLLIYSQHPPFHLGSALPSTGWEGGKHFPASSPPSVPGETEAPAPFLQRARRALSWGAGVEILGSSRSGLGPSMRWEVRPGSQRCPLKSNLGNLFRRGRRSRREGGVQLPPAGEELAVGVRVVMPKPWCVRAAAHYPSQLSCRR